MSFTFRDRLEERRTGSGARQHPIQQPQFQLPALPQAPLRRDRYRTTSRNVIHDIAEEDGAHGLRSSHSLDERNPPQQSVDLRKDFLGGQGRFPFPSKPRASVAPTAPYRVPDYSDLKSESRDDDDKQLEYRSPFQEPSLDVPLGASSSPAFMAGQRHANTPQMTIRPTLHQRDDPLQPTHQQFKLEDFQQQPFSEFVFPRSKVQNSAPITQGIQQVSVSELPDRLRTVFPYPIFNAVQSKCFSDVYRADNNFVLSSPTGSGKTAVLELAICRAISKNITGQYKIVYQAPTKALCSERQKDWQKKFGPLGLECVELTGDSGAADLRNVQNANIIITTPEKWDSVTRKWKDHKKLMQLVSLFLIDEVHLLKEDRGATLEVVVSRMKSIGTDVRFVALSATVPNLHDIASWLGKNATEPYEPALNETFGEEFRPVKLRKHVCGYQSNANDFAFEKHLDSKLPDVVRKFSEGKPVMIFCFTRKSTVSTAKLLAAWWSTRRPTDRAWKKPSKSFAFQNRDLQECAASGVAFHHAGIDSDDRFKIENAYLEGELSVICCTSTLAVGVNLPCHLAIIKNTMTFAQNGSQEYSDLDIMQMIGRAGRPQFDDSAVAVIMTRQNKVRKYELLVTGQDILESTLHLGLIDHLNAEIGLGTIWDLSSARKWLMSTFLYVRIRQNPAYYKLEGSQTAQSIDEELDNICFRDVKLLSQYNLTKGEEIFQCTDYGHAMSQYYVQFNSMRLFMSLPPKATVSEILSVISQASEFADIRFRSDEKALYKSINSSPYIRFPIPVSLSIPAHKVSLLIQSILGGADIPWDREYGKHKSQYNTEVLMIFRQISRLIRCIIDCQIHSGDSVSILNALTVERSLAARVWDDSPVQMKQIETLGIIACRKLAQAGIRSLEELECTEAHRIEQTLGRNPPYGLTILDKLKSFPKLRVSLQFQPPAVAKTSGGVNVSLKIDIGFINEKLPVHFSGKAIYVCLLVETSDGRKVHFARLSAKKLGNGQSLFMQALLTAPSLSVNCHVMCDGIAGTMRTASITPKVSPSMFPPPLSDQVTSRVQEYPASNISRRRTDTPSVTRKPSEDFDDGIDDDELVKASLNGPCFDHIDNYANPVDAVTRANTTKNTVKPRTRVGPLSTLQNQEGREPRQLDNGKWACNHFCKNKEACKHLCCKQGMDKPSKKTKVKREVSKEHRLGLDEQNSGTVPGQRKNTNNMFQLAACKRKSTLNIEELDLTEQDKRKKAKHTITGPKDLKGISSKLHRSVQNNDLPSYVSSIMRQKPSHCYSGGGAPELSFLKSQSSEERPESNLSSDYGDLVFDDLSLDLQKSNFDHTVPVVEQLADQPSGHVCTTSGDPLACQNTEEGSEYCGEEGSVLEDAMWGVASQNHLMTPVDNHGVASQALDFYQQEEIGLEHMDDQTHRTADCPISHHPDIPNESYPTSSPVKLPMVTPEKGLSLFLNDSSSSQNLSRDSEAHPETSKGFTWENRNDEDGEELMKLKKPSEENASSIEETGCGSSVNNSDELTATDKQIPDAYQGLEPWLFEEFGDIVEIVD